ncbi:MAG: septal ring lytic transglycosylase RlpA family protein [Victivallales bacterium]|nr:septal ring lytic transglycosylase RlpA family protein [Victivallales bacterium]MCF7888779.1 septal ring lytic transglycosylase RlpA family protein [Victivallales bacterium]
MLKIIDFLCHLIWLIFIAFNKVLFILFYFLIFIFTYLFVLISKLGPIGKVYKKVENPGRTVCKYSIVIVIDTISTIYKGFLDYAGKSKIIKRVFAVFFIILAAYMIYPPSHWGPWEKIQEGTASWYGPGFYWHRKADGSLYYPWDVSAASKTIPLGKTAKVKNLENGSIVYVKIDDRGPYKKGRILDLSYLAALKLGMKEKGLAKVAIFLKKGKGGRRR